MVFQGTVLRPGLWNIMYEDAKDPITKCEFTEVVYADDLNAFRAFDKSIPNDVFRFQMHRCQGELREWGRNNQIEFDPAKESMHVVGRQDAEGSNFKIVGVQFDCKRLMGGRSGRNSAGSFVEIWEFVARPTFFL